MKYQVKFNTIHQEKTGNVEYTKSCLFSDSFDITTEEIKQFGEKLTLVTYKRPHCTVIETSTEEHAVTKATEMYCGHVGVEVISVEEMEDASTDEESRNDSNYVIESWSGGAGGVVSTIIKAKSYKEAVEKFESNGRKKVFYITKTNDKAKTIIDAENLLYEIDANRSNEIIIREGFNIKTKYTRKEVEEYLRNELSSKRLSRKKALEVKE